jgi:hypothetical protein
MISQIAPNTLQHITPISNALSALSPFSSIVARLDESIKNELEANRDFWFAWLIVSTVLVFIGVVFEEAEDWMRYLKQLLPLQPLTEYRLTKKLAKIGRILIVAGVMGEGICEVLVFRADANLQRFDEALLTEARRQSFEAATSATTAHAEADAVQKETDELTARLGNATTQLGTLEEKIAAQGARWKLLVKVAPELARNLAPFAGQRVGLFVCGQQGVTEQETIETWGAIASILGTETISGVTGAKWNILPPNLKFAENCGGAKGLGQGVIVFVSKRASQSTLDAANMLGHGLAKALPPSPNKMPSLIDPDIAKLTVDRGFQDRNAPWVSVGLDPDLITILVGEHP